MILTVRALRVYATVFLVTGVTYGLIMGALLWEDGLVAAVRRGLIFGLLMSAVLGTAQVIRTRHVPPGGPIGPRQRMEVPVRADPGLADRVESALRTLPATIGVVDPARGRWEARTRVNWLSFGEEVVVQLTGDRSTLVAVVTSRPRVRSTVVDYGRGRTVVERVARTLTD